MFGLGTPELLLIAVVILLLFGGAKIPEMMRGLGKGVRSFKEGLNEVEKSVKPDDEPVCKEAEKDKNAAEERKNK